MPDVQLIDLRLREERSGGALADHFITRFKRRLNDAGQK